MNDAVCYRNRYASHASEPKCLHYYSVRYGQVEILTHMVGKKVEEVSCDRDFANE